MLNRDDRRRLEAIEQQLQASDPELARLLTNSRAPAGARFAQAAAVLTVVIGTLGLLLGMIAFSPPLVLLSVSVVVIGWIWVFRLRRTDPGSRTYS